VRTQSFLKKRLRLGDESDYEFVPIPAKLIEDQFFKYPEYERKTEIDKLVKSKRLVVRKQKIDGARFAYLYHCTVPGEIDLAMVRKEPRNYDALTIELKNMLRWASLPPNAPSTDYFSVFLKNRFQYLDLFFTVDDFSGRIHTPVSSLKKDYRKSLLLAGLPVVSIDVAQMQPQLLGLILENKIGHNEFSTWLNKGLDIYEAIMKKLSLENRNQAKKKFFEILFSPPSPELSRLFGNSQWIDWINCYKQQKVSANPHTNKKPYSNLAWLLQKSEVKLMRKVWQKLVDNRIMFLTVHDEIVLPQPLAPQGEAIFREVLTQHLKNFSLKME